MNCSHGSEPLLLQPSYARSKSLLFDELRSFRISLKWCALDHSSCIGRFISYLIFALLTIFVPIISSLSVLYQIPSSDMMIDHHCLQPFGSVSRISLGFFGLLYPPLLLHKIRVEAAPVSRRPATRHHLRETRVLAEARQGVPLPCLHTSTFFLRRSCSQDHFLLHRENYVALRYLGIIPAQLHRVCVGFGVVGL